MNIKKIIIYIFLSVFCYANSNSTNVTFSDDKAVLSLIKSKKNLFCTPTISKGQYATRITGFDPTTLHIFCGITNTDDIEGEEETSADKLKPLEEVLNSEKASIQILPILEKYKAYNIFNNYANNFSARFNTELSKAYDIDKLNLNLKIQLFTEAFNHISSNLSSLYLITPFGVSKNPNTTREERQKILNEALGKATIFQGLVKALTYLEDAIKPGKRDEAYVEAAVNNVLAETFNELNSGFYYNIPNYITISQLLAGMSVLNPDILNFKNNSGSGITDIAPSAFFSLKKNNSQGLDGDFVNGVNSFLNPSLKLYKGAGADGTSILAKTAGSKDYLDFSTMLSLDNLNYYVILFQSIQIVYNFLTKFLLVLIGTYFGGLYMVKKGFSKFIEKQQSQVDVKSKLALIIVTGVLFFIPINQENQITTTIYQNTWKKAVNMSMLIADKTNQLGFRAIVNNSFGSIESPNVKNLAQTFDNINLTLLNTLVLKEQILKNCYEGKPYDVAENYQVYNELEIKNIEKKSTVLKNNTSNDIISFRACREMEQTLAHMQIELAPQIEKLINSYYFIESFYRDIEGATTGNLMFGGNMFFRLKATSLLMADITKQLGWISSAIMPSYASIISINLIPEVSADASIKAKTDVKAISKELIKEVDKGALPNQGNIVTKGIDKIGGYVGSAVQSLEYSYAEIIGGTAYLLVPGVSSIFDFVKSIFDTFDDKVVGRISGSLGVVGAIGGALVSVGLSIAGTLLGALVAIWVAHLFLEKVPLLIGTVIGMFAVAFYFYELIIYTFISPFVVLFAMTTGGQTSKIQRFLTTGVILVLKPTLIVLSMYIAIYTFYIFQDIGKIIEESFFASQYSLTKGFIALSSLFFMSILIKIITTFGAIIILYKTITGFPNLVFKLLGLQDVYDNENVLSEVMKTKSGQMSGFQ
ncbi:hypothetical protein [Campylobacter sp. RM12651]|uniref:hypothetical protein n=1 Tax=Campylobacter sp. RM12651 TaxID=1660079 RepID=UPI001EFA5418|nr:hypothetical protein [Campylobacter sp. RM12651]ULO04486.1 putative membrane protein [Campylobacter sp. RM12651]